MGIVYNLITVLHVFVCFVLILMVLLQAGKGGGMMGIFGGSGQDSIFGGQGPAKPLAILTSICAGLFMITSVSLSLMSRSNISHSVTDTIPIQQGPSQTSRPTQQPTPAPATPSKSAPAQSAPASGAPASGQSASPAPSK